DNMSEFMGVRVDATGEAVHAATAVVADILAPVGEVTKGSHGYVVNGLENASFKAINLLWNAGVPVRRVDDTVSIEMGQLDPGDWVVSAVAPDDVVAEIAESTGINFYPLEQDITSRSRPVERRRIAMYQRYFGGNSDEGWTRWLLEDFEFPYTSIFDARILEDDLIDDFDVLILPADGVARLTGETDSEGGGGGFGPPPAAQYPPEYRSGFGQAGVDAIKAFVEAGGTLVTFAEAGDFAIQKLDLPLRNGVAGLPSREFWSPGSTLEVRVDNTNPFAYGMPDRTLVAFLAGSQVYEVVPGSRNHTVTRVVEFIDRDILRSGWLIGEEHLSNKATMVTVDVGRGTVVLIGFRAQHRAQTHGTFKLVFNALVSGPE
ncbi:MAG: peptidase M14 family protein, partial [Gemmatimonadota bacterium]